MDPILVGAGLAALLGGRAGYSKASKAKAAIKEEIGKIDEILADLNRLKGKKPEEASRYLESIKSDLPVKPKEKKGVLGLFRKNKSSVDDILEGNIVRLSKRKEKLTSQMPSTFKSSLGRAALWGLGIYGAGKLLKNVLYPARQSPYEVYYPDYSSM